MKKILTFSMLFLSPFFLKAQLITDYKALGDKAFANKDYYAAAVYYQKITADEHTGAEAKPFGGHNVHFKKSKTYNKAYLYYRLAESYRLYQNYVNAEPWYYRLLEQPEAAQYPQAKLWYGVCLRANQHFDEAIKQLEGYLSVKNNDKNSISLAEKEIANCRFAQKEYQFPKPATVEKMKGNWNSDGSNYSLKKLDSGNYFLTSSRYTALDSVKKNKPHLNRIFYADKNSTGDVRLKELNFPGNNFAKEAEWGTPALSAGGKRLYFTYWFKQGSRISHAIYKSEKLANEQWSAPQKLNINVNVSDFNAIQPFVTADGKQLFFASNKPGSLGGCDLWMSDLDEQGNPINSLNLGPEINSDQDEQAPFYNQSEKRLVYSSKGFTGLGGFDLMESSGTISKWSKPENMGYPINSAKDDLYYTPDPADQTKVFISSDRQSDCCLDLFTVITKKIIKKNAYLISGLVLDCETQKQLIGATVSLPDSGTIGKLKPVVTDLAGKYLFEVSTKMPLKLLIESDHYFTKTITVSPVSVNQTDTLTNPEMCLNPVKIGKAIVLKNILFDYKKATLRPVSKIDLDTLSTLMRENPKIKIELSAHTDAIGSDSYNEKLSQARAQSCTDYLIATGISADRIVAKGYGESKPVAPNKLPNGKDNPAGRQLNRRTEFTIL